MTLLHRNVDAIQPTQNPPQPKRSRISAVVISVVGDRRFLFHYMACPFGFLWVPAMAPGLGRALRLLASPWSPPPRNGHRFLQEDREGGISCRREPCISRSVPLQHQVAVSVGEMASPLRYSRRSRSWSSCRPGGFYLIRLPFVSHSIRLTSVPSRHSLSDIFCPFLDQMITFPFALPSRYSAS